jgi:uncharacterized protein (DUF952 family)
MKPDLIFHVVSRRKWPTLNKSGYYKSEDLDEMGGVVCVKAGQLQAYLNEEFNGRKNLLILVIDTSRVSNRMYDDKNDTISVEGGINLDAILDKIRIDCSEDGTFNVEVEIE